MSIASGTRTDYNQDPKYGRLDGPMSDPEQSRILKWNMDMKRATHGLAPEAKLPKGFERLKFLPMMWGRSEKGSYPSGKTFMETTHFPEVRSFQLPYPARINVIGGTMSSEPVTKTHYIGGTTTRGDHITGGYSATDCARAIIADPNWGSAYLVWPITEDEDAQLAGLASSDEVQDMVQHRKQLMEQADAINFASKGFGLKPGEPLPGQAKMGPAIPADDLMAQAV